LEVFLGGAGDVFSSASSVPGVGGVVGGGERVDENGEWWIKKKIIDRL
jgi:hypothetical protein